MVELVVDDVALAAGIIRRMLAKSISIIRPFLMTNPLTFQRAFV